MRGNLIHFASMLLLLGPPATAQTAPPDEILTNQAVVDMVVAKLPKDLIMDKIRSSRANFDVSATGLVWLNNAKVPKDIIKLMMGAPQGRAATSPALSPSSPSTAVSQDIGEPVRPTEKPAPPAPPPPPVRKPKALLTVLPTETGIHFRADGVPLTMLEPNSYMGGKTSNTVGAALTGGISKAKLKAVITSSEASIRISDPNVEFYFVFEHTTANLGGSGQGWGALTSPNEFTLLRLDKKDNRREVTTAAVGAFGAQSGNDDKAVVPFTFTRLKPGVYRVVPKAPLPPGEYAFFPATMGGQGTAGAGRLFDFGVDH